MNPAYPFVSIIIPVKNEAEILKRCLTSLFNLDYPQDSLEIIVADGNSSDETPTVAEDFGAKVVFNEKEVVVSGRNVGFKASRGDLVAFTDADCTFDSSWLKNSLKYFEIPGVGGVGGPTFLPKESSDFEKAVDLIFLLAENFSLTVHRKKVLSFREVNDLPGCNAIYKREALEKVIPVEEIFLTAEDVWMNYRIRQFGFKLIMAEDVYLWHHRRSNPKRFLRQVYRFSIGRVQVGMNNLRLLHPLHILVGWSLPAFLFVFFYLLIKNPSVLIYLLVIVIISLFLFSFLETKSMKVSLNFLLAIFIFIIGWSLGFWRQIIFPLKEIRGK
ncbi:MAG: glycosyltransferase [Candidatus Omnitrophica bacterium]|nr:glycosyltransferase [Candidatus Omnitrophota bacterium]